MRIPPARRANLRISRAPVLPRVCAAHYDGDGSMGGRDATFRSRPIGADESIGKAHG